MKRKPPEKVSNRKVRPALNPEARENPSKTECSASP